MKIRRASRSDIEQLVKLFEQYRIWYKKEPDAQKARKFLLERMEKSESIVFVAEAEDGQLAGFTQLYPLFSSTRMRRAWLLNDLFVDENERGKGISKLLIEEAKEHCRSTDGYGVTLETGKDNRIGNQLYPKAGFHLNSECNFYEWINT